MKVYNVAILGTGFGGLCTALRLREEGENDFVLLEKAGSVGGTWRDNTYPGAACDVKSHLYWPSFAEKPDWSKAYCDQPEILRNIELMVEKNHLEPHIRFKGEVGEQATMFFLDPSGNALEFKSFADMSQVFAK